MSDIKRYKQGIAGMLMESDTGIMVFYKDHLDEIADLKKERDRYIQCLLSVYDKLTCKGGDIEKAQEVIHDLLKEKDISTNIGSSFDSWLEDEGIKEEVDLLADKKTKDKL